MFAINHAATALILKKRYPEAPMVWLLISVQLVEFMWVIFHFIGIESTHTESVVKSVADVHLSHMPFSHSIMVSVVLAILAWVVITKMFAKPVLAIAVAIGVISHIILDMVVHVQDLPLLPFGDSTKIGSGLYGMPMIAFVVELAYGVFCWRYFRGGRGLLIVIVLFNIANLSFFSAVIPGPEELLANKPLWIAAIVGVQIVVTLYLVGKFSKVK